MRRTGGGEYGRTPLTRTEAGSVLLADTPAAQTVWMSHGDAIGAAPTGAVVTATSPGATIAAFEDRDQALYGVQYHPEVVHTDRGTELLRAFLFDVCGCRPTWTHTSIIDEALAEIRAQVGDERVVCGLSGGVDSAVAAALVHKAVGDQLTCVFVDTGLLRLGEAEQVEETFRRQFQVDLVHVKAADRFIAALADVTDPEQKRKLIGQSLHPGLRGGRGADLADAPYLVQGTLYPDIVESRARRRRDDQVAPQRRRPARRHALRARRAAAQPLQGRGPRARRGSSGSPRTSCGASPSRVPASPCASSARSRRSASTRCGAPTHVVAEEVRRAGLYRELWQAFAVLPAVRTVGVMGDGRTYEYPVVVRAVTSRTR